MISLLPRESVVEYRIKIMSMDCSRVMLLLILFFTLNDQVVEVINACSVGFYNSRCPRAEVIIRTVVSQAISHNKGLGAGLLRMHFHDCFVEGCDGSVLLDSTPNNKAEKDAIPNLSLRGFEVIDLAKAELEAHCPNVVSCADILAFAARDSVHLLGGPFWQVSAGRRDGLVSNASHAVANLPAPFFNVKQLTHSFGAKGLTQDDMVTLSGAHTIGVAHCLSFRYRLYNFSTSSAMDPTLNEQFVEKLKAMCPQIDINNNPKSAGPSVGLDSMTPDKFDNAYYFNVELGQGLLQSDEALFLDPLTSNAVRSNAISELSWSSKFKKAMAKMSLIEVKTETLGEIRHNCHVINTG